MPGVSLSNASFNSCISSNSALNSDGILNSVVFFNSTYTPALSNLMAFFIYCLIVDLFFKTSSTCANLICLADYSFSVYCTNNPLGH